MTPIADTFVYIIAFGRAPALIAPVKVGVSNDPESRLASLQTASPYDLSLVAKFLLPSREIAIQMEQCFHHMARAHRLRGEWFDMPPHSAVASFRVYLRWAIDLKTSFSVEDQERCVAVAEAHLG